VGLISHGRNIISSDGFRPVTIVDAAEAHEISSKWLFNKLDDLLRRDDVLSKPFLDTVIIRSKVQDLTISTEIVAAVAAKKNVPTLP
jgi:hypothetical protein